MAHQQTTAGEDISFKAGERSEGRDLTRLCPNRMSHPLRTSRVSGPHDEERKTRAEIKVEVKSLISLSFSLSSLSLILCLVTADQASGTLINQTSPAAASFRLVSLVQLYRDMAIKTKRQRKR